MKIGNFGKNVFMLAGGTAFAQALSFLLIPIITRVYTPQEYGVLAVYASIIGLLGILGSMNYELAIPIAESEKKAINVLFLSILTLTISFMVLVLLFVFIGDQFLILLNSETLIEYKYLLPIGFFFIGLYNILTQWAFRRKGFKVITKTKYKQAILQNLSTIGLGVIGIGSIGLLIGKIVGQSAGISSLLNPLVKKERGLFTKINKRYLIWAAKRYSKFPLYTTPRRYLGDITIVLPVLFITSLYGAKEAGLFGLANSVIQLPMNLVGTSVSSVFYAESASLRATDPARLKKISNKLLRNLIFIGFIPLIVLLLFGPYLFSIVFGSKWSEAGIYASLLSIAVFSRLIFKPISNIFDVFEKQKTALILNVLRLVLVLAVFGTSKYLLLNTYWTVGLYSLTMALIYFIQYLLAQKILNDAVENFEKNILVARKG
ncbi:oligosaccharide flippase family protein [Bacillus lacus]|uniref:Oligosaccharide flippase family protein n=1 Tax=Metabacillus lacus TaxID=1983721 RepID=A0A7X2LXW9_9BACI|nr:oligosaccharide flippase family protein [Metabacillus lacus]MRX72995.1 oligosaccharide flippase family protein [Metabacillus lacus]